MSDSTQQVSAWLTNFGSALDRADFDAAVKMFEEDSYWRDLVSFTWNIITLEGKGKNQGDVTSGGTRSETRAMADRRQCHLGEWRDKQLVYV